ncbi:helix-turn-helix domain-containing protein [Streptococcus didelphis]|uniref:Helix-turn-helix domain-containing protein n=1 Tax=Streptococcus didelphis TaxID=102886 RepID=A0ABY9LGB0_9STRE|nr:helix-turn-helix domain-containing protein [Streptococcus didelphis]WMB27899.1 helix-turn-helix domain-containing protein [Streptococcus didelphis]WMB29632.1 helix-turn-helix domain-containing protein [Streptococcus didelphis]
MTLKDLFPDMQVGSFPLPDQDWISIEEEGHYLHFPKDSLSEREQLLLALGRGQQVSLGQLRSPWYHYLLEHEGQPPESFENCQLIYLNHHLPLSLELIDLLRGMIGQVEAVLPISQTRTALLCPQESSSDLLQLLGDLLPTIESDFGLALTIFMGNSWHKVAASSLRDCFEEENRLLTAYLSQKSAGHLLTFSEVILWGLLTGQSLPSVMAYFNQRIKESSEVAELVKAMWQSHANLVQTAQKLFIHRNSLQYKLDKLSHQTGLNLKHLDDLAFAYLLTQK